MPLLIAVGLLKGMIVVAPDADEIPNWGKAARKAGLHFLIFAIPGNGLTKEKWEKFLTVCRGLSSADFALLPAIETTYEERPERGALRNYRIISFGMRKWVPINPQKWWGTHWSLWTKSKATQILSRPWEINRAVVRLCNAIQGAEAVTVTAKGVKRNDVWADYVKRGFRVGPVVIVREASPDALLHTDWALYAFASEPREVLRALNFWDGLSCFISNGPVIEDFRVEWEGRRPPWLNQNVKGPFYARPGGWFCAPYGEVLTFKIVAHSTAPIMEVAIIGNRDERIAIARPGKRRVNLQLNWRLVESAHVRLKVTDKNGREAETSVISIWGYPGMNIQDCLDGNNIFASGRTKRQGTFGFSISDRSNWWHTLFSIAINSHTPYEYLPQVLRAIEPGCSFGAELHTKEGDLVAEKSAAGRIFRPPS